MRIKSNLNFDFYIFFSVIILVVTGIFFIYSSGVTSDGTLVSNEYLKQTAWAIMGMFIMSAVFFLDYKQAANFSLYIYLFFNLMLVITLLFGTTVNGSKSWLGIMDMGIQPSEFAKLSTIIMLSTYYSKNTASIKSLKVMFEGFIIVLVPIVLILMQPDTGTALVFIPIFFGVSFIAGTNIKYLLFILLTGLLFTFFTVFPVWEQFIHDGGRRTVAVLAKETLYKWFLMAFAVTSIISLAGYIKSKQRYYYWLMYFSSILSFSVLGAMAVSRVIRQYQLMRLVVFIDPYVDPRGAGWHIIQSLTAVGSGGLSGKGFLQGTQSHLRYLPQQSTDFIFSIIAEEIGFLGCLGIFILFFVIIARGLIISASSRDPFGANISAGIVAMIFFHFIVNVGMAMGIMPITGIPLFYLSYGGSSLWTAMAGAALLINIYLRRYRF